MSQVKLDDPAAAADWFELACLAQERPILRRSAMDRLAERAAPDLEPEQLETQIEDVVAEIRRRTQRAGDLYPFEVDLRGIRRREVSTEVELLYRFLVLMSAVPAFRRNRDGFQPGRVFERLVATALARYTAGESIVFGDIQRTGVRERIRELGRLLHVGSHPEKARPSRKDHGLDVASWRTLGDQRAAHPIVLCQCTLKRRGPDLILKARDIQPGEWGSMLDVREGTLSAALAIPHSLPPGYDHWDELRRNTDLIIERIRLLRLLDGNEGVAGPLVAEQEHVNGMFKRWLESASVG